jgi:hypothetical protein
MLSDMKISENASQDGDLQRRIAPVLNFFPSNQFFAAAVSTTPSENGGIKSTKSASDQALEVSNFLAGFDVTQLQPGQLGILKDLRLQLDDNIRAVCCVWSQLP